MEKIRKNELEISEVNQEMKLQEREYLASNERLREAADNERKLLDEYRRLETKYA
jgi:hypothetical protein